MKHLIGLLTIAALIWMLFLGGCAAVETATTGYAQNGAPVAQTIATGVARSTSGYQPVPTAKVVKPQSNLVEQVVKPLRTGVETVQRAGEAAQAVATAVHAVQDVLPTPEPEQQPVEQAAPPVMPELPAYEPPPAVVEQAVQGVEAVVPVVVEAEQAAGAAMDAVEAANQAAALVRAEAVDKAVQPAAKEQAANALATTSRAVVEAEQAAKDVAPAATGNRDAQARTVAEFTAWLSNFMLK